MQTLFALLMAAGWLYLVVAIPTWCVLRVFGAAVGRVGKTVRGYAQLGDRIFWVLLSMVPLLGIANFARPDIAWSTFLHPGNLLGFAFAGGWLFLLFGIPAWVLIRMAGAASDSERCCSFASRLENRIFWVVLFLLIVGLVDQASLPNVEWNPFTPNSEFVGTYSDGTRAITFHRDSTFTSRNLPNVPYGGNWAMDDWNLTLVSREWRHQMRHILVEGRSHVLLNEIEDLDAWNGEVGLPKVGGESAP